MLRGQTALAPPPAEVIAIELRHLRYFIAVAEHLNFSRAALALDTAQPSLSQQIMQLEREIGVELFARGKRHIALTPAGHEFLREAQAVIAQVDRAVAHAREAGRGLRGELRLAYTFSAMMTTLPAAIREYRADHPDVRITLRAMGSGEILAALRERQADAGVLMTRSNLRSSGETEIRALGELPIGAMLPTGHRLAERPAITIEEIGRETLILYARHLAEIYDVVLALCRERNFTPLRIDEADRMETIAGLVAAGEGLSIVPRIYETLHFPGVVYTALTPEPEPFAISVVRNLTAATALTQAFAETCERVAARRVVQPI